MLVAHAVVSYLNLNKTDEEIKEAWAYSSMDNMKKIEESDLNDSEDTFFTRHNPRDEGCPLYLEGYRFMTKGKTDRKHELTPEMRSKALNLFKGSMLKYGYS